MLKQAILNRFTIYRLSLVLIGVVLTSLFYVPAALADTEITDCTEARLKLAIANGGIVTFSCSGSSTITLGSEIEINSNATIDGGGTVTLDGGGSRIFKIPSGRKLTLQNITLTNGGGSEGGAVYNNNGTLWVINSTIQNSTNCTGSGGNNSYVGCGILSYGGGSTLKVISSTIKGNSVTNGNGGGIAVNGGQFDLIHSIIENNTAAVRGGGIAINKVTNVNIKNSVIRKNTATDIGGGMFVHEAKSMLIENSLFGGLTSTDANQAERAGGVYFTGDTLTTKPPLYIHNSTFSYNKATGSTKPGGLDLLNVTADIRNSTFSGNEGGNPGAIRIEDDGVDVTIVNTTIANNIATLGTGVGGIQSFTTGSSTLAIQNSILANNTPKNCRVDVVLTTKGGNVHFPSGGNECGGMGNTSNPSLNGLDDYGGAMPTMSHDNNSIRIATSCSSTDQRGFTRPSTCDAGSYHLGGTVPDTPSVTTAVTKTATAGEPVYELTVTGTDFNKNSIAYWNEKPLPTVYNSATELIAYVSIADYNNSSGMITVSDGDGGTSDPPVLVGPPVPPDSVTIVGTADGLINSNFSFTATVLPAKTTLPLTYTWGGDYVSATTHIAVDSLSDTFTVNLDMAGNQDITVTVQNMNGTVVNGSHNVLVIIPPDASLIVATKAPTTAEILDDVEFEVSVPTTTTTPITYIWEATEQSPITQTDTTHGFNPKHNYTWVTSGTKYITLTIKNQGGEDQKFFSITITVPPIGVGISGPDKGGINTNHTFTAAVLPDDITRNITYQWEATDITKPPPQIGTAVITTASFSWTTAGSKIITITASDATGTKTVSKTIVLDTPPLTVLLTGPMHGEVGQAYTFTAISDLSTTTPITYLWEADGQTAITQTTQSGIYTDTASWTWDSPGQKMITVTAKNLSGEKVAEHAIEIVISPAGLMLSGPTVGRAGNSYNFKAIVSPTTTTRPLTYTWQADGLETKVLTSTILTSSMSLTWMDAGTKTITVTAYSSVNSQSEAKQFLVLDMDATGIITLDGTTDGTTDQTHSFTATLDGQAATEPVTYTWEATDKDQPIVQSGGLTSTHPFTWDLPGIKVVTLTAESPWGTEVTTREVNISLPVYPPISIVIEGVEQGNVDNSYQFEATVSPTTTTTPLTYTWQATDFPEAQSRVIKTRTIQTNTLTDTITYTWAISGEKVITVTAENASGMVTTTYSVMVYVPPLSATIEGPITGFINTGYTFTTTIMPISPTMPITYVWSPEPMGGEGAVISYTWDTTGTRTIILTATNVGGWITTSHTIDISINDINDKLPAIYLPIVVKLK
ncbi:right-handed parallel beta-helix repeat-containing protein [Anaerolineales bacterium HSG24]|nr:right-handed parallel beta-helix repeat-containing protein [Anaerolineales bacterium HSG24]